MKEKLVKHIGLQDFVIRNYYSKSRVLPQRDKSVQFTVKHFGGHGILEWDLKERFPGMFQGLLDSFY